MTSDNHDKPPRVAARIKAVPAIRQLFWCDFPKDAQLPEFWKRRPVIILSYKNILSGTVTVVPCSSQEQLGNKWSFKLTTTIDGLASWAICDKITSVAVSRLTPEKDGIKRLPEAEFNEVLSLVLKWLPSLPEPASSPISVELPLVTDEPSDLVTETTNEASSRVLES